MTQQKQTRRPGTIPGKKKATLYLDEAVHKALRIKAAETGESMGDIAERALRKELGLMGAETAINTVNRLLARRNAMGALSEEEHRQLENALAVAEEQNIPWAAWLGDIQLGTGPTKNAAIEDAVRTFEQEFGYDDDITDREALIARLSVGLDDQE